MSGLNGFLFLNTALFMILLNSTLAEVGFDEFEKQQVVPDQLDSMPKSILNVSYDGDIKASLGNVLTPTQVQSLPKTTWDADMDNFYVLIMTDLDVPSRKEPRYREAQHYIVGNIPGNKTSEGNVLTEYIGAGPRKGTGLHRYVLLVYEQPKFLNFEEKILKKNLNLKRVGFSSRNFARKYELGEPIAGNFFQAEWDSYVPNLYAELTRNTKTSG